MREILFRGKTDKGEWVVGNLMVYYDGSASIIEASTSLNTFHVVAPENVGQYTGLTDKNDKRIFEGDILKGEQYPYKDCDGDYNYFAEVVWFDNSPAFGIYTFKNPKSNMRGASTGNTDYFENFASEDWEVIGNIYDNPELLEENV